MIKDIIKSGKYRKLRSMVFFLDWFYNIIFCGLLWTLGVLVYSFVLWRHPIEIIKLGIYLKGLRISIVIAAAIALFYNKESQEAGNR